MQILSKDRAMLLTEACKTEDYYCCTDDGDCEHGELDDELFDIPELEDELEYHEEMVAIIQTEGTNGSNYLVEFDSLLKLMEFKEYTAGEAVEALAEHNVVSKYDMYVVIESEGVILEKMKELGSKGGSMLQKDIKQNAMKTLKDLKDQGLNVVKKKSKSKKKKKKK